MSRSVDDVEPDFLGDIGLAVGAFDAVHVCRVPEAGDGGGRDGDAALALLFHPVRDRVAFVHLADLVRHARIEEDALRSRGLARVDVGDDAKVTD